MRILLVTTCCPFTGEKKEIQNTALHSWSTHNVDIVALGNDEGTQDACDSFGLIHLPNIQKASDFFRIDVTTMQDKERKYITTDHYSIMLDAGLRAIVPFVRKEDIVVWLNSDLVLLEDIYMVLSNVKKESFVGWARRWDYDYGDLFDVPLERRKEKIWRSIEKAKLHPYCGIDVFIWTGDMFYKQVEILPPFVVDAWATDHYFKRIMPTLTENCFEFSNAIKAIHLNHGKGLQFSDGWNKCAKHNRELLNIRTPKDVPLPTMI